jgi:ferredoxin-NADP reductase
MVIIKLKLKVSSYIFEMKKPILYEPGQNVILMFRINNKMEIRTYTITSVPSKKSLEITIKNVGLVSNHIHKNINVNNNVILTDIIGDFVFLIL